MSEGVLARLSEDRAFASVVLFGHRHPQAESEMHVEMMDMMASADEFIVLEAFREAGKTTKAEEHICLAGCFGTFRYGLLLGETYEKACERLASIAHELQTNEVMAKVFGGSLVGRRAIENKVWFRGGALLQAWGWDQELQSFKYGQYRPDFAFLDDVENLERVRDRAAVEGSMRKLYHDLIPAMDKERRKIVVSQTRRAEDCMVTRLAANEDWLYRGWPICNGDPEDERTVATWPARYPMEWVRAEQRRFERAGMSGAFLQAYMLQAVNPESKPFREEMLVEWEYTPWAWMPKYVIYDPSRTTRERRTKEFDRSDRCGKVVVSKLGSKIVVHESGGEYWKPDAVLEDMFATQLRHAPVKMAVEKNSLDEWLLQPIRLAMLRRGEVLPLVALQAPQDRSKEEFILGLQPFAAAKEIVLVGGRSAHAQLVAEFSNFPSGPRDVLNALAYSLRLFGGYVVYADFSGNNIGDAPNVNRGEDVFVAWNASASEVVALAVQRDGRRLCVSKDWSGTGAISDVVKTIAFEVRSSYPLASLQHWVPAETFDQWQRIALVPALRAERFVPLRGEHVAAARGALAERIRTKWHDKQLLIVDRDARLCLNALAAGYAYPVEKGGRQAAEPESGVSRLVAEALECMIARLDRQEDVSSGIPKGANVAYSPGGAAYVTSHPVRRT